MKDNHRNSEERDHFLYAQRRVRQKRMLFRHFIVFLIGSAFIIILNQMLGVGKEFFIKNWWLILILIWLFLVAIHTSNVYIVNKFMGKEWEHRQLNILREKQVKRIARLEERIENEIAREKVLTAPPPPETPEPESFDEPDDVDETLDKSP